MPGAIVKERWDVLFLCSFVFFDLLALDSKRKITFA
jgi:hypothetical protein